MTWEVRLRIPTRAVGPGFLERATTLANLAPDSQGAGGGTMTLRWSELDHCRAYCMAHRLRSIAGAETRWEREPGFPPRPGPRAC